MSTDSTLPVVPVVFRSIYDRDSRKWFTVAAFPTIPANSGDGWQMEAFNFGSGEHCAIDPQWFSKGRPATREEIARVLPRLRSIWEDDLDFPCRMKVYHWVAAWMKAKRQKES